MTLAKRPSVLREDKRYRALDHLPRNLFCYECYSAVVSIITSLSKNKRYLAPDLNIHHEVVCQEPDNIHIQVVGKLELHELGLAE